FTVRRPTSQASRKPIPPRQSCPSPSCSTISGSGKNPTASRARSKQTSPSAAALGPPVRRVTPSLRGSRRSLEARSTPPASNAGCDMTSIETELAPLEFSVTKNLAARSAAQRDEILQNPGFGTTFTDHMVDICWSARGGWHRPRVQPYGPIALDPAAAVLHYAQEIFEGIKAYRHADGAIHTFRADQNAARMQRSARRLALPELPTEYFLQSLRELIAVDGAWTPSGDDQSL